MWTAVVKVFSTITVWFYFHLCFWPTRVRTSTAVRALNTGWIMHLNKANAAVVLVSLHKKGDLFQNEC